MISDPNERRGRRLVAIAFVGSLVVHALVFAPFLWLFSHRILLQHRDDRNERFVVSSTSVRIERRIVPQPQTRPVPRLPQPRPPIARVVATVPRRVVKAPKPRPTELAKFAPTAPPQSTEPARPRGIEAALARQQTEFSREVARLHEENNPMSIATAGPLPPSSYRKSYVDVFGKPQPESAESLLLPVKHWIDGPMSCYYVTYTTQFDRGGSESGNIPWPVCYPRNDDKMLPLDHPHELPIPYPPRGYRLPPTATITAFLRSIYDRTALEKP